MPGMGDMSSMMGGAGGDFGGIDFSKLGGGLGAEGGEEEEGDDDDDDDMPELEGDEDEEAAPSKAGSSKIEEVAYIIPGSGPGQRCRQDGGSLVQLFPASQMVLTESLSVGAHL